MIDNFTEDDDDDDDGSDEEEDEQEEENISESVETSTSRFGRFMSPLAFSKFSETLGLKFISLWLTSKCDGRIDSVECALESTFEIIVTNLISLRYLIARFSSLDYVAFSKAFSMELQMMILLLSLCRCAEHGRSVYCEHDTRTGSVDYKQ